MKEGDFSHCHCISVAQTVELVASNLKVMGLIPREQLKKKKKKKIKLTYFICNVCCFG